MAPPAGKQIRVLCVDDNHLIADAIHNNLQMVGGFDWAGQLSSADHLLGEVRQRHPDIVLLDIDMPGKDPFEAMSELSRSCPDARVLVLSGHVRQDWIDRAVDSGAWGYVSKSEGVHTLVSAIRRVARGHFVLGPDVEAEYQRQ